MDRKAMHVLKESYQLDLKQFKRLRERGLRCVWYIRTDKGDYCFKKYDLELKDYQFSFALQKYLMTKELPIPRLIPAIDGQLYAVDSDKRVYVLFEWIRNEQRIDMTMPKNITRGLYTLALFHRDAYNFTPNEDIKVHRRYRLNAKRVNKEIETLAMYPEQAIGAKRLSYHHKIVETAYQVRDKLEALFKNGTLHEEARNGHIAHNDFADINLLATDKNTYMIDFDDATYNFPTIDFEAIFIKTCLKKLIPPKHIPMWFKAYESCYRLSPALKKHLIYHLQIPTMYRRILNNQIIADKNHDRYMALCQWESEKNRILQKILENG